MSCIFCRHTGPQPPAHTWKRKIFHTRQRRMLKRSEGFLCALFSASGTKLGNNVVYITVPVGIQWNPLYCEMSSQKVSHSTQAMLTWLDEYIQCPVWVSTYRCASISGAVGFRCRFQLSNKGNVRREHRMASVSGYELMRIQSWLVRFLHFFSIFFAHNPISRHNGNKNTICFESLFPFSICWLSPLLLSDYYYTLHNKCIYHDFDGFMFFLLPFFACNSQIRRRMKIAPRHMNGWLWSQMGSLLREKTNE